MALPEPARTIPPVVIQRAQLHDLPQVSRTLAAAFQDDPVMAWVVPDEGRRRQSLPSFFMLVAAALARHDLTYQAGELGTALWVPPGKPPIAESEEEAFGARLETIFGPDMDRLEPLIAVMEKQHPHEPHQYLWFLAVHPSWQGHGIGAALLTDTLEQLDEEGTAAYLEATSPDNVRLYRRYGFEITGIISEHGGAPLWQMWREPQSR
jgi:ribosomal protein S18 acetylase RimI-like enzyme